ncbi:hypothetical protein [Herbaspirillum aquaticum]|uniref:hypothetical protein n=1 Tax=Herbaspirillum aquaticum TaxID=568783 RepID=UPI0024DE2036|nr:hypothetical protein [Herbaspirillum aquaticum]
MSKAIGGGGGSSDLLLVALLIGGALMYSKMGVARAGTMYTQPRVVTSPTVGSGATGVGSAQVAYGVTAALAAWMNNMAKGMPDTYNASAATGGYNSFGTFGPIGGSADDPWYG